MKNRLFTSLAVAGTLAVTAPLLVSAQGPAEPRAERGERIDRHAAGKGEHGLHRMSGKHHEHARFHDRGSRHGGWHAGHAARHGGYLAGGQATGSRFLHGLDLSEAQRDRLFELRHSQAPALREQGKILRDARRELRTLSMSDGYDEAKAGELSERAAKAGAELGLLRARGQNEVWKLLTAEQREKLGERAMRGEGRGMAGRQSRS